MMKRLLLAVVLILVFSRYAEAQSSVSVNLGATYANGSLTTELLPPQNGNVATTHTFLGANGDTTILTLLPGRTYGFWATKADGSVVLYGRLTVTGAPQDITSALLPVSTGGALVSPVISPNPLAFDVATQFLGPDPYNDAARYGLYKSGAPPATTASCTNTSPAITLVSALDYQDASKFPGSSVGNGIVIYQCGAATGLATPPAPGVTPAGVTGGATTYNYQYVAEDQQLGGTAAGSVGTTTTGASALGLTTVNLTAVTWNSTANGEQVYTCSANCNVQVNAPIRIDGFTNSRFNGNFTIIAQNGTNQFTVYAASLPAPTVTSESAAATVKLLACNILTMPANTVNTTVEGASGDTVLRWIVYRNGTRAFYVQARDPYYEDCGVTTPSGNFESFVPSSPGSAFNKALITTIVSGAGSVNLIVANAAGNTTSGQTALHDNSTNLLACVTASRNFTPCYANLASAPFNAPTIFTNAKAANSTILLPVGTTLNEPWVVTTGAIVFQGGQNNGNPSFQFENVVQINSASFAFPTVILPMIHGGNSNHGVDFNNIFFSNVQLGGEAFVVDFDQNTLFGLQMDNTGFASTNNTANVNIPAARFKGLSESAIGKPGNRNSCAAAQINPGPPCMRFTTNSVALNTGASGNASVARNLQINGFAIQGSGASTQFDVAPWTNSGGTSPFGATDIVFQDGLREVGKGPYLRVATTGTFYFKHLDDDAPNTTISNGWVDAANTAAASVSNVYYFEGMTTSGGGAFGVTGPGFVIAGPNATLSALTSNHTGYTGVNNGTADVLQASGTAEIGYKMATPAAPGVVVGGSGSCVSNCVAAGTVFYSTTSVDPYGNQSPQSPTTSATTDGTQTITITPGIVSGQIGFNPIRGSSAINGLAAFNTGPNGSGLGGTSYVDTTGGPGSSYIFSLFNLGLGNSCDTGSAGVTCSTINLTGSGFKDVITGSFSANRATADLDVSGTIQKGVGYASQAGKTTAQSAATLFTVGANNTLFEGDASVACDSASAAATVLVTILYTDVSNTAQSIASTNATCTTLGASSVSALNGVAFMAKAGTAIQYSTTIANTPTYDVRVSIQQLGVN